ncbi:hypothetical protein B7494_g439 [Chlorociboria aeruginascens]|nr:hypothetical protein B7494_g439 [Chlorociboria aeruginascens]
MSFFHDAKAKMEGLIDDVKEVFEREKHSHTHLGEACHALHHHHASNRYHSFAPQRSRNAAKWFADGCSYMWAVSVALEEAKESIWILDWWLSPELYLRRPPSKNEGYRVDRMLIAAAERGVKVNIIVYKEVPSVLTLASAHTKHALEVHPNIAVFRHPDHLLNGEIVGNEILKSLEHFSFKSLSLAKLPEDSLKALYGANDDMIFYWAHHEKLCLVDRKLAFMGGLDLCFGRWDPNSHPLADTHPGDLEEILYPGQDFNNARVSDFEDVAKWQNNTLDRTKSGRMGWSDLSICLRGDVVDDLMAHFVQRWNFIYGEKYSVRKDPRYTALALEPRVFEAGYYKEDGSNAKRIGGEELSQESQGEYHHYKLHGIWDSLQNQFSGLTTRDSVEQNDPSRGIPIQLHSIANAYISVIKSSKFFIYIENQFFITATSDSQHPVRNKIGAAIVERVVLAHQNNQPYKVIVCMPSVPAFAGDLQADDSLETRAIMEYQYNSICRGGHSIMEAIEAAGVPDAKQYIRFYNLRNFDRINANSTMSAAEKQSGVSYETARKEHDDIVGAGYGGRGEDTGAVRGQHNSNYDNYQAAATHLKSNSNFDTITSTYMLNGPPLASIPWTGAPEEEIKAFISEELYIHTKVLIADDEIVICGSANLNDRSQLGDHDSEIAVVIEDPEPIDSVIAGQDVTVSKFAAGLRRQLFRKHLGLLPFQDWTRPDSNFYALDKGPNSYDWGSPSDLAVQDIFSPAFTELWDGRAKTNTEVFAKAFHCVPADHVRNWDEYDEFYGKLFVGRKGQEKKYEYGHVVEEEFPGGVEEVKAWLGRVKGSLVEMSLNFMEGVDFAKEGLTFNALTDEIYT